MKDSFKRGLSILKRREDLFSILFIGGFLAAQFVAFRTHASLVYLPVLIFGCAISGAINHNQMHVPVFTRRSANMLYNFILSFAMGSSSSQMAVTHVLIHHRYFRDERDWTRNQLAGGRGLRRLLSYWKNATIEIRRGRRIFFADPAHRRWRLRAHVEKVGLWLIGLALFAYYPLGFLCCYLLPWVGGLLFVLTVNLLQHDDLDLASPDHSRNFLSRLANLIAFNAFYHTVHHENPALHWSDLPSAHRSLGLTGERSFWAFLFRRYVRAV